jgi:hypothetical protein
MTDDRRSLARTPWKTVSTRPIYANQWIRVREDIAEMPDGYRTIYGVIEARPAVGVLPFVDDDTVLLVGQYRYVFGRFFWEIPPALRRRTRASSMRSGASWRRKQATSRGTSTKSARS